MKRNIAVLLTAAVLAASSGLAQAGHPRRVVNTCDRPSVRYSHGHSWAGRSWGHRPNWSNAHHSRSGWNHRGGSSLGISFTLGSGSYRSGYSDCAPAYRHVDRYSYYTPVHRPVRTIRSSNTVCTTREKVIIQRPPVTIIERPRVIERRVIETRPVVQVVRTQPVVTRPARTTRYVSSTPTVIEQGRRVVADYRASRPDVILADLDTGPAWRALADRETTVARDRFAKLLADHPDHPEVLAGAALVLAAEGEVSRAERLMRRATRNGLARARERMPELALDAVLNAIEDAYERDTIRDDSAWYMLASIRLLRSDESGAELAAKQALRYDRYDAEAERIVRIAERERGTTDL